MRTFFMLLMLSLFFASAARAEEHVFRFQKEIDGAEYSVLQVPQVGVPKEKPQLNDLIATYDWFVTKRVKNYPAGVSTKDEVIFRSTYELRQAIGGHHELHVYDLCFVGKDQLYLCGKLSQQMYVIHVDLAKQQRTFVHFRNEGSGINPRITQSASIVQHEGLLKITVQLPKNYLPVIYEYDLKTNKMLTPDMPQ